MSGSTCCARPRAELGTRIALFAFRVILAVVFFLSCWDKLLHPRAFRAFVLRYDVPGFDLGSFGGLPVALATLLVPMLELMLGVLLLTGVGLQGASILTALLYLGFLGLLIQAKVRGIDIASCGCFSVQEGQGPAWLESVGLHIVLDAVLLAMAAWVYWRSFVAPRRAGGGSPSAPTVSDAAGVASGCALPNA